MKRLSSVAAIACVGIISIGLTGCGGGGGGGTPETQAATAENPCPIPQEVKAAATLDVNKTVTALSFAQGSADLALMLSDDGYYWKHSTANTSASSYDTDERTLTTLVSSKVKTLQKTTGTYKKALKYGDDSIEYGDNIPCSGGGTYSAHDTSVDESNDEDGVSGGSTSHTFTLTFNQCVLQYDNDPDLIRFFRDIIMYNASGINRKYNDEPAIYTFNGSLALEYSEDYTYDNWDVEPKEASGYGNQDTFQGSSSLRMKNLHFDKKVGDVLKESFDSNEVFTLTFHGSSESNTTYTYESIDAYNDNNYTTVHKESYVNNIAFSFDGQEEQKVYGSDWNRTISFSALCYSAKVMYDHTNQEERRYEGDPWNAVEYNYANARSSSVKSSGYLALQRKEGTESSGYDLYTDNLTVAGNSTSTGGWIEEEGVYTDKPDNVNAKISIDGTVGSTLFGGSVVLATVTPWKMSSDYPGVMNYTPLSRGGYELLYFPFSPYEGETTITGTNSATVKFYLEDNNDTDVNLSVDGQTTHFESVYEMFDMIEK